MTITAPIQSTRLSSSVDGSSASKTKYPKIMKAEEIPANKNMGERQVGLWRTTGQKVQKHNYVCRNSLGQLCEDTPQNVAKDSSNCGTCRESGKCDGT